MSVDAQLDAAFTTLLAKARTTFPDAVVRPITINFVFGGGALPIAVDTALVPTSLDPLLVDIPMPCRLVRARMRAGGPAVEPVPVTATVDLQLSQFLTFGVSQPLYGSGAMPGLSGASSAEMDITDWLPNLTIDDSLSARLATFSGTASWVSLTLLLRPTDVPLGISTVVSDAGNTMVNSAGNQLAYRN